MPSKPTKCAYERGCDQAPEPFSSFCRDHRPRGDGSGLHYSEYGGVGSGDSGTSFERGYEKGYRDGYAEGSKEEGKVEGGKA